MIKFFNVNSGETVEADTEEKIAALWSSSDRSPNVSQGQDFGWRMAEEVVVELEEIASSRPKLMELAAMLEKPVNDIKEYDILTYISMKTDEASAPDPSEAPNYKEQYEARVRKLRKKAQKQSDVATE